MTALTRNNVRIAGSGKRTILFAHGFGCDRPSRQGLGLGLYIASEIARAHGGVITATSDESETAFTFRMPATAPKSPP